jgi:hypothetical protein
MSLRLCLRQETGISGRAGSHYHIFFCYHLPNFSYCKSYHVVMVSQWVWRSYPAIYLIHSDDECIGQWEVCSKFKILCVAAFCTLCARVILGSTLCVYIFWRVQTYFWNARKYKFFVLKNESNLRASVLTDELQLQETQTSPTCQHYSAA